MRVYPLCVCAMSFLRIGCMFSILAVCLAGDGYPKTAGVGQYCSAYYEGKSELNTGDTYFRALCGCKDRASTAWCTIPSTWCPTWYWGNGCHGENLGTNHDGMEVGNNFCDAGCVDLSPCTNISNAHFTGPGTANATGVPTSCPWACNDGHSLVDGSCVITLCAPGSYMNGTECKICNPGTYTDTPNRLTACADCAPGYYTTASNSTTCLACATCAVQGYYKRGCNATSPGVCVACTPTLFDL